MKKIPRDRLERYWKNQNEDWRYPEQIVSGTRSARPNNVQIFSHQAAGAWWDILRKTGLTLIITREYENFVMALSAEAQGPHVSALPLPHPSGVAVDDRTKTVWVASTRNPNQVMTLQPARRGLSRDDQPFPALHGPTLMPVRAVFYPGSLYLHDLAYLGGQLYGASAGTNSIVTLNNDGSFKRAWSPAGLKRLGNRAHGQNYLQLNSIAAGRDLRGSYFSASCEDPGARRPGDPQFPVDQRGVIFSGRSAVTARGLTRPHSARWHRGKLWVANSGYGEFGSIEKGAFRPLVELPGWTRGVALHKNIAFVGTSHVITRFRQYAPGLDLNKSTCGVHAVSLDSGKVLGSLTWPWGNQLFAVAAIKGPQRYHLPICCSRRQPDDDIVRLFYSFSLHAQETL